MEYGVSIGADRRGLSRFGFGSLQFCFRSEGNGVFGFDLGFMLQQFSWGAFLIASIVLNLVWYVFVGLVFYRSEVLAFLYGEVDDGVRVGDAIANGGLSKVGVSDKVGSRDDEIEREVDAALMGTSKLPDGVEVKSSAQVSFAASGSDGRYDQVGLVADVVQELKLIFLKLEKGAGDKRDFFRLLEKVKEEYGPLGGHPSVAALTGFIVGRAPFHLTADEIENLWY
ncbi:hypothetical protein EZ428_18325 [Pedobacter frigiditerrae]|uniref:Uncharacterized protein n=1 Tax=Pedobacter frigiditerrae TaxID=2530452 RepID=A0A4V2MI16_9SPHI|nr:hypothetical protein [Pedobacter frigiditerrae]TCC88596.1 hypothetical protein EZ428_18325 [Pedobacter frigiditerrae]